MGLLLQSRWRICVVGVATPGFITLAYASYLSRTVRPVYVGQIRFEREHVAYQTRTRGACVRVFSEPVQSVRRMPRPRELDLLRSSAD